ncbi:C-X-C motif chemokine 11 Beta-R1 H174 Interferon gamma-inducible protein 9 [Channa argus]|uniref:C-X-C motif chemokine 11 Beta-R1 H174 Interferon gamma-inducible protein 9 n=1 Tax=Channa argus TaxID=215402 RepID=A0A6G1PG97_CHAAH|nr:C-X-C motif chemokine 11 Beta-R1 H174 Interferon gamma-inducible protein 9 [Channa argus]
MKTVPVITFLTCLLVLCAQGLPASGSSKCKCLNSYIGRVSRQQIKGNPVIHLPSTFCPHTEIIVTTTTDKEKCVNPQSPFGKLILKNHKHKNPSA